MFSIFRDIYQISLSVIIMFRRAQYARWQERLFPADFRGDRPCPASRRRLGKPCGGTDSSTKGTHSRKAVSLFTLDPGQYERSMGTSPATGQAARRRLLTQPLNSAADDGRCHGPRVSFDPSGHGSGECCSCAAGAMLSPWRAGSGGCHAPWTVFSPYRPNGSQRYFR